MGMTDNSNEIQIRTLLENWARAVREQDMDGVLTHHADDIVMFDVPVPLQSRGAAEYKKTWELFFAHNLGGEGGFDLKEVRITASDSVAFCHGLIRIFGSQARLTMGLVKSGEQWIIAHEHHSYPAE
jgi:ketosteroid isomerase-like protein